MSFPMPTLLIKHLGPRRTRLSSIPAGRCAGPKIILGGTDDDPSRYSGTIADNEWLIGEDKTLSPSKYYIIITALFGNGQSSSPTNKPDLKPFPNVLFYDNVRAQHELVTKKLGVQHARAVLGWSMGAGQTYDASPNGQNCALTACD